MKSSTIIGKKIIDKNGNEIGKIGDIDLDISNCKVDTILVSSSELSLKKDNYELSPTDIITIGEYVLVSVEKNEIIKKETKEVPDVEIIDPKDLEDDSSN